LSVFVKAAFCDHYRGYVSSQAWAAITSITAAFFFVNLANVLGCCDVATTADGRKVEGKKKAEPARSRIPPSGAAVPGLLAEGGRKQD